MTLESFEVSKDDTFGDLLNDYEKKQKLKVGVYTAGYFEYWRMYPGTLEAFVRGDLEMVWASLRKHLGPQAEIVWPGLVSTLDEADRAGRLFKKENVDLVLFVAFTYTVDVISLQCLRYVEKVPLILFLRQSHRDIDFQGNYEQTLRNSAMIAASQLTGTFRKMGIFENFEVVVGADFEEEPYREIRKYFDAVRTYHYLRELNIGIIGHVFRGMFDHEFDRTASPAPWGRRSSTSRFPTSSTCGRRSRSAEVAECAKQLAWAKDYRFQDVTEEQFLRECRFTVAYKRLIRRFRLDAVCFLGQHYVEVKTGCTGYLATVVLAKEKQYMANTEGDVNGLIMMCIMNKLTGQAPLFGEWGEYGEKENAMQMMMHGYGDPDLAKGPEHVKITATPENWGHQGSGLSVEYTARPGPVTIGHLIDDKRDGWRMLIGKGEALDAEKSIPLRGCHAPVQARHPHQGVRQEDPEDRVRPSRDHVLRRRHPGTGLSGRPDGREEGLRVDEPAGSAADRERDPGQQGSRLRAGRRARGRRADRLRRAAHPGPGRLEGDRRGRQGRGARLHEHPLARRLPPSHPGARPACTSGSSTRASPPTWAASAASPSSPSAASGARNSPTTRAPCCTRTSNRNGSDCEQYFDFLEGAPAVQLRAAGGPRHAAGQRRRLHASAWTGNSCGT